jgi:hypothetical protein
MGINSSEPWNALKSFLKAEQESSKVTNSKIKYQAILFIIIKKKTIINSGSFCLNINLCN